MKRLLCLLFGHRWIPNPPLLEPGQLYTYEILFGYRWLEGTDTEPGEFRPVSCGRCGRHAMQFGRIVP